MAGTNSAINRKFKYIPFMSVTVDSNALKRLEKNPNVKGIFEDYEVEPTLLETNAVIQSATAWATGYTGSGWTVAVLDTGVDSSHSWFSGGRVVSEACYSTNDPTSYYSLCPGGVTESTASGSAAPVSDHGTHVAGIAAGNDTSDGICDDATLGVCGVGNGADIIATQVYSSGFRATTTDLIKAMERVYELTDSYSIAAVNMSLSTKDEFEGDCDHLAYPLKTMVDTLRSVKVATVVAAGNEGHKAGIGYPSCISTTISVGATNDLDAVAGYSNIGANVDLLAPGGSPWVGTRVVSSVPGGGTGGKSGTSMAAPHVAGAWAVLKEAASDVGVVDGVDDILEYLHEGGVSVDDDRSGGTVTDLRRIDLAGALNYMGISATPLNATVPEALDVVLSGDFVDGGTLIGDYTFYDEGDDSESGSTYQWQTAADNTGAGAADIPGATGKSYVLTASDLTGYIRFCVTPSDGVNTGAEACSIWRRPPLDIHVDRNITGGAADGSSWTDAYAYLQDGLSDTAAFQGDTVHIAEGVYYPDVGTGTTPDDRTSTFILKEGVTLLGGYPTGGGARDWQTHRTVLSGDLLGDDSQQPIITDIYSATGRADNALHVVTVLAAQDAPLLNGLYITAGYADGSAFPANDGGGIYAWEAPLSLQSVQLSGNFAADDGGGLMIGKAQLALTNTLFLSNYADGSGGGLYTYYVEPEMNEVAFVSNAASLGGGIYNFGSSGSMTGTYFYDNSANYGGGLMNNFLSSPNMVQTRILGNYAAAEGGGLYNWNSSSPTLTNALISGNYAGTAGGGVVNWTSASPVFVQTTISGNYGGDGGGIYNWGSTLTLKNSILWGNGDGAGNPNIFSDAASFAHFSSSIAQGSGGSGAWDAGFGTDNGGNLDQDPLFISPWTPASAPTVYGDYNTLFASPAVDAGDNTLLPADAQDLDGDSDTAEPLPLDLTPDTRVVNGAVDMGAFEWNDADGDGLSTAYELQLGTDPYTFTPYLVGTGDTDALSGGASVEVIAGLEGRDSLTGNGGGDVFLFTSRWDGGDTITDFTVGEDRLAVIDLFAREGVDTLDPLGDGYISIYESRGRVYVYYHPPGENLIVLALVQGVTGAEMSNSANFIW